MANRSVSSGTGKFLYIVAPSGKFGTIQAAIDAAVADGYDVVGTTIGIAPGTYTEDLTLSANVNLAGMSGEGETIIIGQHTPPAAGSIMFSNLKFQSAASVLLSAAADTCDIKFYDCLFLVNGYIADMTAWTGSLVIESCSDHAASVNGIAFNNGAAVIEVTDSQLGDSTALPFTVTGITRIYNSRIYTDMATLGAFDLYIQDSTYDGEIVIGGTGDARIFNSYLTESANAVITTTTTGDVYIAETVIDTPASPCIVGTSTITLASASFLQTSALDGALTLVYPTTDHGVTNSIVNGIIRLQETNAAGTTGIIYKEANPFIHSLGTNNTFIGEEAGNLTLTELNATDNTVVGYLSLSNVTTGARNCVLGSSALNTTTGSDNIAIGEQAGSALVLAESDNIIIGNVGTVGDNQTIRIGTAQTSNYQEGIYQATSGATKEIVFIDSNHKLSSSNIGFTQWIEATADLTATPGYGYIINIAVPGLLTITLPVTSVVGDVIEIAGYTAGMWSIAQNALQVIHDTGVSTTVGVGGSLSATTRYDTIKLLCVVADTEWVVLSGNGAYLIV